MNVNEVNSQESLLQYVAALQKDYQAEGRRVDLSRFLEGIHCYLEAARNTKRTLEPNWHSFALLLRIGRSPS